MQRIPFYLVTHLPLHPASDHAHSEMKEKQANTSTVLGQGAAQAQEDAISIAVLLQLTSKSSQVPELLKLYDGIRRERAHEIQQLTRLNGVDADKGRLTRKSIRDSVCLPGKLTCSRSRGTVRRVEQVLHTRRMGKYAAASRCMADHCWRAEHMTVTAKPLYGLLMKALYIYMTYSYSYGLCFHSNADRRSPPQRRQIHPML